MSDNGRIEYTVNNHIARINFYHPKSNSLPGDLLRNLATKITDSGADDNVKVIILGSEGEKVFCAGASFDELASIEDFETGKKFFMGFASVINAMRKCPKFIIGRVQGKTAGGGVGLAAACDYTIALKSAPIRLSEFALGIGPFVVGPIVERKIGRSAFSQLATDAEWYDADWAFDKGLFFKLADTTEELDNKVNELANKLATLSPEATMELKKIYWEDTDNWDELLERRAEISGRLVLSDFTKNYIRQFKEK